MDKIKPTNPNTIERMNEHYAKFSPEKERYNQWMMPHLIPLVPFEGKILEVGCGFGKTLYEISKETSADLIGIELSPIAVDKASKHYEHITFKVEDCENMDYKNEFDLVICSQTLEHVDYPELCVKNMMRSVKEGGYLFITVPWPNSNLDKGVKLHYWTFYPEDYQRWLEECKVIQATPNHMIVIYQK